MAGSRKSPKQTDELAELRKKYGTLKKQVQQLVAERDCYLHALHAWAKKSVSQEDVRRWMAEEKIEGSLLEFIDEVKEQN